MVDYVCRPANVAEMWLPFFFVGRVVSVAMEETGSPAWWRRSRTIGRKTLALMLGAALIGCSGEESSQLDFREGENQGENGNASEASGTSTGLGEPPGEEGAPEMDARSCDRLNVVPITLSWTVLADVPGPVENVAADSLELIVQNHIDVTLLVALRFAADAGRPEMLEANGPTLTLEPGETTTHEFDLQALGLPIETMTTSGMLFAAAHVTESNSNTKRLAAVSPPLFWHYGDDDTLEHSPDSGRLTVYDERTVEQHYAGGDVNGILPDEPLIPLDGGPPRTPSRVFSGNVAIVTEGKTTPQDLVDAGLIEVIEPIIDQRPEEG